MSTPFQDGSQTLFGRAPDLDFLLARTQHPGLTVLLSRAQMGKTTLLLQLAYSLSASHLVGYTESSGQTNEPLRYAVQDLYTRWLAASSYTEQAATTWHQQKEHFVEKLGETTGSLLTTLAKAAGKPLEAAAAVVKTALDGLVQANQTLRTGGQQLPQLQIEQARDLLQMVASITGRPLVIILDQWEQSIDREAQLHLLEHFLKHLGEWPACHIVVGTRDDQPLRQTLEQRIGLGFLPRDAILQDLPFMHLDQDHDEQARLLVHIRAKHALTRTLSDNDLLGLIGGYPEVVNRWVRADSILSRDDLTLLATNAHRYLYPEFQIQLPSLPDGQRLLAMRLALLPGAGKPSLWTALEALFMEGVQRRDCDTLKRSRLLDRASPPSFGHAKRAEAALAALLADAPGELADLCERLILSLAQQVHDTSPQSLPFISSLVYLESFLAPLDLSPAAHLLCYAAQALFGEATPISAALVRIARKLLGPDTASVTAILANGLFNTLIDAKQEGDPQRRDDLLQELRDLARDHPADNAVRENLAKGLYNTLLDAQRGGDPQRRDDLLQELRDLARDYTADNTVREPLAKGLFNTLTYAQEEGDPQRRNDLLQELRDLARDYPQDNAVRENLANGLFNTLIDAKKEGDPQRRNDLLQELRDLARDYPQDNAVRENLANGLFNTLNDAQQEDDLQRRDNLLQQLRDLAREHPADNAVRENLANGLFNTLIDAKQEDDLQRRDNLLQELRDLAHDHPQDNAVREKLAKGLYNTLNDAGREGDPQRRDDLLRELRDLRGRHPDDAIWQQITERIDLDEE